MNDDVGSAKEASEANSNNARYERPHGNLLHGNPPRIRHVRIVDNAINPSELVESGLHARLKISSFGHISLDEEIRQKKDEFTELGNELCACRE